MDAYGNGLPARQNWQSYWIFRKPTPNLTTPQDGGGEYETRSLCDYFFLLSSCAGRSQERVVQRPRPELRRAMGLATQQLL
jgi:hypothetical protein